MTRKTSKDKGWKYNLPKGQKTSIQLKPAVKKRFSQWMPLIKILLLVVLLYVVSKLTIDKLWDAGLLPNSRPQKQTGSSQPVKTKTVWKVKTPEKISSNKETYPSVRPVRTQRTLSLTKPKLVFVVDDIGHTLENRDLLANLGNQITYAILPLLTYSRYFSQLSFQTGAEVILHQPMEAKGGTFPGPGLITSNMTETEVREVFAQNLRSVPQHSGLNNHMGSAGTSDPKLMRILLSEVKNRNLLFLDSRTSFESVGYATASQIGVPALKRDVFLDNIDEEREIRRQIEKLKSIAQEQGFAIAIGHDRHNTLKVLNEEMPKLQAENFEIVSLSELLTVKKR